jgi:hypothetical protein
VYYAVACAAALLLLALGADAPRAADAQVDITVDPSMVKGPSTAPVTIIEFSDYQ